MFYVNRARQAETDRLTFENVKFLETFPGDLTSTRNCDIIKYLFDDEGEVLAENDDH